MTGVPSVAPVSGPRGGISMGLELAEARLLAVVRHAAADVAVTPARVVGGRAARRHARRVGGRWIPAPPGRPWGPAWWGSDLVHLVGLDLRPPRGRRFVATVHDLAPLIYDDEEALPPWFDVVAAEARTLLTPSAFTAAELTRLRDVAPERITVVGAGPALDASNAHPLNGEELRALGIRPPFVLRYGGYTRRKNVRLLLEAWRRVPDASLVLAGPPQPARDRLLRAAPLDRVVVLDYVPAELLARLLRSAAILASPSEYEGFGLPVVEAMAAGAPVVAARTQFVQETCGDAAFLVDPDPVAFGDALAQVLEDRGLAERLRAAGLARSSRFTWSQSAGRVLRAYIEALR